MLLRLLFPSWAFFDAVHEIPCLEIRRRTAHDADAMWEPALVAPPRRWYSILWNARGNAHLAMQGIVDRFAVELEHGQDDEITRALVHGLARRAAAQRVSDADTTSWEWRVVAVQGAAHDAHAGRRVLRSATAIAFN